MSLVIDANIFAAFYQEYVNDIETKSLTKSPIQIFENLNDTRICYFDENGFVKDEWSKLAEPEWFDVWYTDQLLIGNFLLIPVKPIKDLHKQLSNLGFPKSKDIWYIKICKEVCCISGSIFLVSEDMDFYNPSMKKTNSKNRLKIINSSSGVVAKYLKKKENIYVKSVHSYIDENLNNNT